MISETTKAIGLELANIRKSRDLLITEVSEATKINKDTISKYENGNSSIKIYILDILLNYYDVSIDIFFKKVYFRIKIKNIYKIILCIKDF